ncbi:polyketide synthase, partial [Aureobasidium melanogenum]
TSELPPAANTRILALCTGSLAAAAVASARTLDELVTLGVETVRIAFRTGVRVNEARTALGQDLMSRESWSTIVTGINEQSAKEALSAFHESAGIPTTSHAYISAVSTMAITISGPPTTTKRFFEESEAVRKNNRVKIPVYAPYHAEHLYSSADIETIIGEESAELLQAYQPRSLVHSGSSGMCHIAENTFELFKLSLNDMLRSPVGWNNLLEESVSQITANTNAPAKVFCIGVSNVSNSLVSAIKAGGQASVSLVDHSAWESAVTDASHGRTQNDKIAIVGMSGRFPSAASTEALWELLEKGLDVHRKIPSDRFDADAHCDPSGKGKNKSHTPYGCFIDEPGLFDPRFFNMSPREAAQTDPMGRLALVTAYEALEQSGYVPNRTPSTKLHRIGTFYGQTSDDWREINASENVDTYFITGGVRAFAP